MALEATPGEAANYDGLILQLGRQPRLAHQALFSHRHGDETPPFHYEIIDDLHSSAKRVLELAFRGAGKSTIAEEYIVIEACFRRFRNWIIIGESATRACERLAAIKHELDFNEHLRTLFGDLHGPVWNEDKIVLSNGLVIQAFGRGQSLRGTKHEDVRPDRCLIDDIEDEESVNTTGGRDKVHRWVMRTLLPALDPTAKIRMLANMLDPDCLAIRLERSGLWTTRRYPWCYASKTDSNQFLATWPSRFPMTHVHNTYQEYRAAGLLNEYMQEFMVTAVDPSTRIFTAAAFKVEPLVRTWQATYAVYDPARTVKASSAHTGKVVFSWIGTRLMIWEAVGALLMPDEIIADVFKTMDDYNPVKIGVEKDGLEEFMFQPLRAEMTRRRQIIPVIPLAAPAGKLAFIRALQPFFAAGEVIFTKDFPILKEQLLSFPTGRIDVPNALAYALRLRPGLPVYDNFGHHNVTDDLNLLHGVDVYLVVNATRAFLCACLVQLDSGQLRIVHDWIMEGDPGLVFADLIQSVALFAPGRKPVVFAPPQHWNTYDTLGLHGAAGRSNIRLSMGGPLPAGREQLRAFIDKMAHGRSALQVSPSARWTLNAFSGGYAKSIANTKPLYSMSDEGMYSVLMEGLESFAAAMIGNFSDTSDMTPNYAVDGQGRRYLSAMPKYSRSKVA